MAAEDAARGQPPPYVPSLPDKRRFSVAGGQDQALERSLGRGWDKRTFFQGARLCRLLAKLKGEKGPAQRPRSSARCPARWGWRGLWGAAGTRPAAPHAQGKARAARAGSGEAQGWLRAPSPSPAALLPALLWGRRSQSLPAPIQSPGANQLELSSSPP